MNESIQTFLKGQFLIAMPVLDDPIFHQTVTCISEHTSQGAVGVIVNRTNTDLTSKDIFDELKIEYDSSMGSIPIHIGGPVHIDEIFVLHGPPFSWEGSFEVSPSLCLSNTRDILEAIAMGQGPSSFIITLGCAGWAPGQLESEIKANAWLTCNAFEEIIFDMPMEKRWEAATKKMGIDPSQLSDIAGHA
ncbi:MAG: YqgE/AlgH family protein [Deltaproteobacteria bacterium]|nr:YqgE/AlgH family protein [Deltaproteobacteria bacterium]MBW1846664.1 YqgE/AlgH family protein [Deltaproteobacteria bacterium]MBW2179424.1 YqgE/AlgH family protein [Deltaproteobacteria bacterium]